MTEPFPAPGLRARGLGLAATLVVAVVCTMVFGPLHERVWHDVEVGRLSEHREATVVHWMKVLNEAGVKVPNSRIGPESVELDVVQTDPATGKESVVSTVVLGRKGLYSDGLALPSFSVRAHAPGKGRAPPESDLEPIARRVVEILGAVDNGQFFRARRGERFRQGSNRGGREVHKTGKEVGKPQPERLVRYSVDFLVWWVVFLSIWYLSSSVRIVSTLTRERLAFFAAITLGALLIRFFGPIAGPIHANEHGIRELSAYMPASLGPIDAAWPDGPYGYAGSTIYRFLALFTGSVGTELLSWMGGLMAFGTLVIARVTFLMTRSEAMCRMAAVWYAILPIAVRSAPTESPLLCATLFVLMAILVAHRAVAEERWEWLCLAMALSALAIQTHIVTVAWLVPIGLAPLLFPAGKRRWGFVFVGLLLIVTAPHLIHAFRTFMFGDVDSPNPLARVAHQMGHAGIGPLNPFIIPFAFLPLTVVALVKLQGTLRWIVLLTLLTMFPLAVSTTQTLSDVVRYQAPLAVVLLVLASYGLWRLCRGSGDGERIRVRILNGMVLFTIVPSLPLIMVADPETAVVLTAEEAANQGHLIRGLDVPSPRERIHTRHKAARPWWVLPESAPRDLGALYRVQQGKSPTIPVLITTGCITQPDEGARAQDPLDAGCARALGRNYRPLVTMPALPEGFAGLPLWFHPRRPNAPSPGVYLPEGK